ncbi:MAG TPA: MFS transporter, partial [Paraburkholderia sp.]
MKLRSTIILMTTFAVVSDAILIPFYPQFFAARYGVTSPVHAGAYVAFISIVVMLTLPLWARIAKRIDAMHLLVYTQCAAGVLSVASYFAPTVALFWVLSLAMFMCKSSYLLMYPYMMRLEPKESHAHTIGVLSVVVHFGAIAGAVAGGFVMQVWDAHHCIFAMAAGDFVQ